MRRFQAYLIVAVVLGITITSGNLSAATPNSIQYQGRLTLASGAPIADTFLLADFRIYDAPTGGNILWDSGISSILTKDGWFSIALGTSSIFPFPATLFEDTGRYLGVSYGSNPENMPRLKLGALPYSRVASAVTADGITSSHIADFTIANSDIADAAVESIITQDNSLKAQDLLEEPGITSSNSAISVPLVLGSSTDIITTTITIPTSGYIFLVAKASLSLGGATLANTAVLRIEESASGTGLTPQSVRVGNDAYKSTVMATWPVTVQRVYFKGAGTYTFRLKGFKETSNGTADVISPTLTAIFFSTSYGTVQTVTSNPGNNPEAIETAIIDESGSVTGKGWEVDLRYYEMQAKKAQEEALRAELDLRRARARTGVK